MKEKIGLWKGRRIKVWKVLSIVFLLLCRLYSIELTLDDCIKLTFENNPTLKAKLAEINSAKYSYYSSLNNYYPKLSLSSGFSRAGSENRTPPESFSASGSLSQTLFNYNSLYSIKSSKINYELAELDYESYLIELRKNLYSAFYNLFFSQELLSVYQKIVEIRKANAELIELKYQSGFESKGNMLYAKAQYEMAKLNLEKTKRQIEIASNNLKSIIGVWWDDVIIAKMDLPEKFDISLDLSNLDSIVLNLPQYRIYKKNIELAKEKLKNSQFDWLPSLSFSASRSYSGNTFFPEKASWSLGVNMNIPLFSSGITYRKNNIKVAEEGIRSLNEKMKDFFISRKNAIVNAYFDYKLALETLNTYKIFLQASEERFNEAKVRYLAGKISYIDLENIEQNLIDARQSIIEYTKNLFLKKVNFDYLLGEILK